MKTFKDLVVHTAYPVLVGWPVLVCSLALWKFGPMPTDMLTGKLLEGGLFLGSAIPVLIALVILEKRLAAQPEWRASKEDQVTDATYLAIGFLAITPLAQQLIRVLAYSVAGTAFADKMTIWPSQWPLLLQLALAMVVGEFGQYWFHRAAHETDLLWRVHATHHGTPQVYWLNSTRFHPIEVIVKNVFQVGPLIVLGCGRETFLVYGIVTACHGWIQHSNVAYRTALFDWFDATPANHRWHHSVDMKEANHNYGNMLIIWDHVFGSHFKAHGKAFGGKIGIGDMPDFPKSYLGTFLSPFRWKKLPRVTPAPTSELPAPARQAG